MLYFAGENPDDVRTRWIKLCDELKKDPDEMDVVFLAGTPNIANELIRRAIENEAFDYGEFSLLVVDTAAAYSLETTKTVTRSSEILPVTYENMLNSRVAPNHNYLPSEKGF